MMPAVAGGVARTDPELQLFGGFGGDREGRGVVPNGQPARAQLARPLCGAAERHAGLGGHRGSLGPVRMRPVGVDVVLRQDAGELVVAERLVVAGRRQVARPTIVARERAVRDLAQQALYEPVVPPLG
jgi:hypothetical protein